MTSHYWHKLKHRGKAILIWCILTYVVWAVAEMFVHIDPTFARWVEVARVFVFWFGMMLGIEHNFGQLCEDCMSEMPLNGSLQAEKWDRHLATVHFFTGSTGGRRRMILRLVLISAVLLGLYYGAQPLIGEDIPNIVLSLLCAWWLWSQVRHDRVQPWCKRCGWDDGGGGRIEMPTPDPGTRVPA